MRKKAVGIVLASVMMVGGVVGATTAYQTFTATERPDIKVIMDGKLQSYKDANGNVVYPLVVNGTTYLPLRPIAGSIGKAVSWNNDTQTITLGDPEPMRLVDVTDQGNGQGNKVDRNLNIENYESAIQVTRVEDYLGSKFVVGLNESYDKLSCTLYFTISGVMRIKDKDTDMLILEKEIDKGEFIEVKDLDIKGIKNLEFSAATKSMLGNFGRGDTAYFLDPVVE